MKQIKFGCLDVRAPLSLNVMFGAVLRVADDVAWCCLLSSSRDVKIY